MDLLLGIHEAALFPTNKDAKGNLRLMESQFGSGLLLEGSHPCIKASRLQMNPEAMHIARTVLGTIGSKARQRGRPVKKATVNFVSHSESVSFGGQSKFNFLELKELGTGQPRRCGTCKNCTRCSVQAQQMTARKQSELALIEAAIVFKPDEKKVMFEYPHIKDVSRLQDNKNQVMAMAIGVEKRLEKTGRRLGVCMIRRCKVTWIGEHSWY